MDASPHSLEIISTLLGAWRIVRFVESGTEVPLEDDQFLWFKYDIIVTGDEWAAWGNALYDPCRSSDHRD